MLAIALIEFLRDGCDSAAWQLDQALLCHICTLVVGRIGRYGLVHTLRYLGGPGNPPSVPVVAGQQVLVTVKIAVA